MQTRLLKTTGVLVMSILMGGLVFAIPQLDCDVLNIISGDIIAIQENILVLEDSRDSFLDDATVAARSISSSTIDAYTGSIINTAYDYGSSYSNEDAIDIASILLTVLGEASLQAKAIRNRNMYDTVLQFRTEINDLRTQLENDPTDENRNLLISKAIESYESASEAFLTSGDDYDHVFLDLIKQLLENIQTIEQQNELLSINEEIVTNAGSLQCNLLPQRGRTSSIKNPSQKSSITKELSNPEAVIPGNDDIETQENKGDLGITSPEVNVENDELETNTQEISVDQEQVMVSDEMNEKIEKVGEILLGYMQKYDGSRNEIQSFLEKKKERYLDQNNTMKVEVIITLLKFLGIGE